METKIETARRLLRAKGCDVEPFVHEGESWYQIDFRKHVAPRYGGSDITLSFGPLALASQQEMEELADGVYGPNELLELFVRRQADEKRPRHA